MTGRINHDLRGMLAGIIFLYMGAILSSMHSVCVENRTFSLSGGTTLRCRLWSPRTGADNAPLVMVCHGITSSKELMEGFSSDLARHGYRACAPDFPFDKDEKNTPLLIELSRALMKSGDNPKIAFAGHSLGAVEASGAAYAIPETAATVAFGLYIGGELNRPIRNVLLSTGLFDRFHPPLEMSSAIRSFTEGTVSTAGTLYGSFHDGSARMLVISPWSEHASEVIDPVITGETIGWLDRSFAHKERKVMPLHLFKLTGSFMMYAGIFLVFLYIIPFLNSRLARHAPLTSPGLIVAAAVAAALPPGDSLLKIVILISLLAAVITANYLKATAGGGNESPRIYSGLRIIMEFMAMLWCSLALSVVVFEFPKIMKSPAMLSALPGYLLLSYVFYPFHAFGASLRHAQDYHSPLFAIIAIVSLAIGLTEYRKPGITGSLLMSTGDAFKKLKFTGIKGIKGPQLALLVLLLPCALFAWWYTMKNSGVNLYMLGIAGYYAARYALVPIGFTTMYYVVKGWRRGSHKPSPPTP